MTKKTYTKAQLTGTKLQRLIDYANGDEDLVAIVASLRANGMHVPVILSDVA